MPLLLLAFIVVPIVELAVIIQVGSYLGVVPTVVLLAVDSILGAVMLKREGRRAWDAFRRALEEPRWPADEVIQGALVLVGGALLLTPGFVTDVVGLALIVPPTRAVVSRVVRRRLTPASLRPFVRGSRRRSRDRGPEPGRGGDVIDVEVVSVDRDDPSRPDVDDEK